MKNVIVIFINDTEKDNIRMKQGDLLVDNQPMLELFYLLKQHRINLKFSQENNICSDVKKASIISDIQGIFDSISKRSYIKISADDISSSNTHDVSN